MGVYIKALSYYLPKNILTNEALHELFPEWLPENIYQKTGIKQRHVTDWDEIASDCAVKAAEKLFEEHNLDKKSIDFILFVTQTPDYCSPTTACLIQHRLGLPNNIGAFDINLGCSGFVYALSVAKSFLLSNMAKNILILTSEVLTKHIHKQDRSARMLFGDAGAAAVVSISEAENKNIGEFVFGTDGKDLNIMIAPNLGFRNHYLNNCAIDYNDEYGNTLNDSNFSMNGPKVFIFSLRRVPPLIAEVLQKNNLSEEDIDLFVFHQANGYLLETLRKKLHIPSHKFFSNIENKGNTVSSTIPIALCDAIKAGRIQENQTILVAAFGVGLSWAATILKT